MATGVAEIKNWKQSFPGKFRPKQSFGRRRRRNGRKIKRPLRPKLCLGRNLRTKMCFAKLDEGKSLCRNNKDWKPEFPEQVPAKTEFWPEKEPDQHKKPTPPQTVFGAELAHETAFREMWRWQQALRK